MREGNNHLGRFIFWYLFVLCVIQLVVYLFFSNSLNDVYFDEHSSHFEPNYFTFSASQYLVLNLAVTIFTVVFVVLFLTRVDKVSLSNVGFQKITFRGLLLAVVPTIALVLVAFFIQCFFNRRWTAPTISLQVTAFVCLSCLCIAGAQELLFRGYFLWSLLQRTSKMNAVIITSCTFTALHLIRPGITPIAGINLFLFGCILGLLVLITGSIWTAFAFHFLWIFLFAHLGYSIRAIDFSTTGLSGSRVDVNPNFGFEETLTCMALLVIFSAFLLWSMRKNKSTYKYQRLVS